MAGDDERPAPAVAAAPDFHLIADSAPVLMRMAGVDGGCTFFNFRWLEFTGRSADQERGHGWADGLHPQDRNGCLATYLGAVERREPFEIEYRLRRADGAWRWILDRGVAVSDRSSGFSGHIAASIDITERRHAEEELHRSREELRLALSAGSMGTWVWDRRTGRVTRDAGLDAIYGLQPGAAPGDFDQWASLVHPEDRGWVLEEVERAMAQGGTYEFEHRILQPDGTVRWVERRGKAYWDPDGEVAGSRGLVVDITARRQAEAERDRLLAAEQHARQSAQQLAHRLANLQAVTADLADARTVDEVAHVIVERGAKAMVAASGALCLLRDDGEYFDVIGHVGYDPDSIEQFRHFSARAALPAADAVRGGQMVLLGSLDERDERYPNLRGLPARNQSFATVPLIVRGRPIGAVALGWVERREFSDEDRRFLLALVQQAAQALDRAYYYEAERVMAERQAQVAQTLQRSLLPPTIPILPGLDLAARYDPIGDGSEVGGDFYDIFPAGGGRWGVVIGDVSGKGVSAASLTALARYTIRTAARRESSPSSVLEILNDGILDNDASERFATIANALVEHTSTGVTVLLSRAGHPPPLLVDPDGSVRPVGRAGTAVGLFAHPVLYDDLLFLEPGQALVFHTDGLIEARSPEGVFADGLVESVAKTCCGSSAAIMADTIQDALLDFQGGRARDDMALLVLRRPPGIFHQHLVPRPEAVSSTRRRLAAWLARQRPAISAEADELLLVATELTTNSVRMAHNDVQLHVWVDDGGITMDVSDDGPGFDEQIPAFDALPNPWSGSGRGLFIVRALMDRCSVQSGPSATIVRCSKSL